MRFALLVVLATLVSRAGAQQRIDVWHGASWAGAQQSVGGLAPGSIFYLQVAPEPGASCVDLARVAIRVQSVASLRTYAAEVLPRDSYCFHVAAVLPRETPTGAAEVTFLLSNEARGTTRIQVVPTRFGLFTQARNGSGTVPAYQQDPDTGEGRLNDLTHPALPGQFVTLWGTGLGTATPAQVAVQLGGRRITPSFAGPAPGLPGVDQINFQMPAEGAVPNGCYVPLTLVVAGQESNRGLMTKADAPGPCQHPFGFSPEALARLDAGGRVTLGTLRLYGLVVDGGTDLIEAAQFDFRKPDDATLARLTEPLLSDSGPACTLATTAIPTTRPFGIVFEELVDAGSFLRLLGPEGKTLDLTTPTGGSLYQAQPPVTVGARERYLTPGAWRVETSGGQHARAFQASATLPPPPFWTNRETFSQVDRQRDQVITWSPQGYTDADLVTVSVSTEVETPLSIWGGRFASVDCRAPARAGRLTVPAALLRSLPASSEVRYFQLPTITLGVTRAPQRPALFPLAMADGSPAVGQIVVSLGELIHTRLE